MNCTTVIRYFKRLRKMIPLAEFTGVTLTLSKVEACQLDNKMFNFGNFGLQTSISGGVYFEASKQYPFVLYSPTLSSLRQCLNQVLAYECFCISSNPIFRSVVKLTDKRKNKSYFTTNFPKKPLLYLHFQKSINQSSTYFCIF